MRLWDEFDAASGTLELVYSIWEYTGMRFLTAFAILFVATFLLSCDQKQATSDIDPALGRECFESLRATLAPGTQDEGIAEVSDNRITIRIMNGIDVTTIDCGMNQDGALKAATE